MAEELTLQLFHLIDSRVSALQIQLWALQAEIVAGALILAGFMGRRLLNGRTPNRKDYKNGG